MSFGSEATEERQAFFLYVEAVIFRNYKTGSRIPSGVMPETLNRMWRCGNLYCEGTFVFRMVMLLLMSHVASQAHMKKCTVGNPSILHRYLQSGDLIIGGITSQISMGPILNDFDEHPHEFLSTDDTV